MEKREDFLIPEEVAEWIGLKKSEYLSKLILNQTPDDVGIEEFHLYDGLIPGTIQEPDSLHESLEDLYRVRTYVKSYQQNHTIHQLVIGVVLEDKNTQSDIFVPILSFVSRKNQLIKEFTIGQLIPRHTLS